MMEKENQSIEELRTKFAVEQEEILNYVSFLEHKTNVPLVEIGNLMNSFALLEMLPPDVTLKLNELLSLKNWKNIRPKFGYLDSGFANPLMGLEVVQTIYDTLCPFNGDIEAELQKLNNELFSVSAENIKDRWLGTLNNKNMESVEDAIQTIVLFIINTRHIETVRLEFNEVSQTLLNDVNLWNSSLDPSLPIKDLCEKFGDMFSQHDMEIIVRCAIELARHHGLRYRNGHLFGIKQQIEYMGICLKMGKEQANLGVFRQGFINLTTIFDATIFDLVRTALKKNFFELIGFFGSDDRIPLKDFDRYHSYEEFRDSVIDKQLKRKYLKDIFAVLSNLRVCYTDDNLPDKEIDVLEMIQRRNIHIHNGGRVDERYLERNEEGKPKYNIYNFSINDFAEIDAVYWKKVNRLCKNCVNFISDWAKSS